MRGGVIRQEGGPSRLQKRGYMGRNLKEVKGLTHADNWGAGVPV